MTDTKMQEAQKLIDEGLPNKAIGKRIGVSEGTIRYHKRSGKLKKRQDSRQPVPFDGQHP